MVRRTVASDGYDSSTKKQGSLTPWEVITNILGSDPTQFGIEKQPLLFKANFLGGHDFSKKSTYQAKTLGKHAGWPYYKPDGWLLFRVKPFCAAGYQKTDVCSEEIQEWPVAYHGTSCASLASILHAGLRKPKELPGVWRKHGGCNSGPNGSLYLSPSLWYSSHPVYSTLHKIGEEQWAQAVLQLRVRPGSFRRQSSTLGSRHWDARLLIDPNWDIKCIMEWLLDGSTIERSDAIIVGLMIRVIGHNTDFEKFGWCPWLSWKRSHSGWIRCKPEYEWTAFLQRCFRQGGFFHDMEADEGYDSLEDEQEGEYDFNFISCEGTAMRSASLLEAPGALQLTQAVLSACANGMMENTWQYREGSQALLTNMVLDTITKGQPVRGSQAHLLRYKSLLREILEHEHMFLDVETILSWHQSLMDGLHPEFGRLRQKDVQYGPYHGMPVRRVRPALDDYFAHAGYICGHRHDLSGPAKAAWCFYHFVRIHPFADGNGRLARLLAIWALRRHGFPEKLCLIPMYVQELEEVSWSCYIEAQKHAQKGMGDNGADTRYLAAHICRCMVATLYMCDAIPRIPLNDGIFSYINDFSSHDYACTLVRHYLSEIEPYDEKCGNDNQSDVSLASMVSDVAELGFDVVHQKIVGLGMMQQRVLLALARRARELDPAKNPAATERWKRASKWIRVKDLLSSHSAVTSRFRCGPHRGELISALTRQLQLRQVSPDSLPPLLAARWNCQTWVVEGNRRLRALLDFDPDVRVRVIVHKISNLQLRQFTVPFIAKFLLAMTTTTEGQAPAIKSAWRHDHDADSE
eukprot:TRINITY_DN31700_c0_g1_i1.p1 TRINITY_DN31700_c0_g1~~TRINITY_DN31700_c0_g1_i1.p1  ORF type:complete len:802 (-),score=44.91 TRINITY_DN31700_c0_g1_i1:64-2469(-)